MLYKNLLLLGVGSVLVSSCSIPGKATDRDFTQVLTEFNQAIYDQGGRAYVVFSAYNNMPARTRMDNYITLTNNQGENFEFRIPSGTRKIAMLPAGDYKVTDFDLYGSNGGGNYYVTSSMNDIHENSEITFSVKPKEFAYLGQLSAIRGAVLAKENNLWKPDTTTVRYGISADDKYRDISDNEKSLYEAQSGKPFAVKLMKVKKTEGAKNEAE
jgi:hypothetical protein